MRARILSKNQIAFLEKVGESQFLSSTFYLTGGTALAGFYLHHRYSEDLDFFSENEFDLLNINIFVKQLQKSLKITKVDFQQSFNRNLFFLHFHNEVLKAEFTYFPFPRILKGIKEYGIEIESMIDIAVNKLFTIYQRSQARDYIDLYCICKKNGYFLKDLMKKARIKFDWHIDPLQLGTQFIKVKKAEDIPRMIQKIPQEKWQDFFIAEAKKFRKDIIS